MSGPTNRRFVRSAWTLLAFQFVAAAGATALAIWAATKVQALIDQRDLLQARVTALEARQAPATPPVEVEPAPAPVIVPAQPVAPPPRATEPVAPQPIQPTRVPPRREGGVTIHELLPPVVIETPPQPVREPPVTYVPPRYPPREPPVAYPPRRPPTYVPPRQPPTTYVPPRQPPTTYVPPRQPTPGNIVRPVRPGTSVPTTQQPNPNATIRPIRPGAAITRPSTNAQPADPRRIRRPRPTDTDPQQNPPK